MRFRERFEVDRLAAELYGPGRLGGVLIQNAVKPEALEALLEEIRRHSFLFQEAPRRYLNARQHFSFFYAGEADDARATDGFETLLAFRDRYAEVCRALGRVAGFRSSGTPNSIAVQKYPRSPVGITAHRDESRFVNLISVFVLKGKAEVRIGSDRELSDGVPLAAGAGDAILMRAPRRPAEKSIRPFHTVGPVEEERISLVFRERSTQTRANF